MITEVEILVNLRSNWNLLNFSFSVLKMNVLKTQIFSVNTLYSLIVEPLNNVTSFHVAAVFPTKQFYYFPELIPQFELKC